ncbi:MAG: hypothetical protein IKH44_05405 [Bacteroidales bacterium]|nr:hypothetical protein [Bacteroidales bacterium]
MRNIKIRKRVIVLAMSVVLSVPIVASAQGGLFQRGEESGQNVGFLRNGGEAISLTNQTFGNPTDGVNVTNQTFGAPLGSGLFTLLLASVGYATIKKSKKENIK